MKSINGELGMYSYREVMAVKQAGEITGYGAIMHIARLLWREKLETMGIEGGEFACGPCEGMLVPCGCPMPGECDWCCGTAKLTKHVKEVKDSYDQQAK